jgi:signal transduction histidine kinase
VHENDPKAEEKRAILAVRLAKQENIAISLSLILPLFVIVYFMALFGLIDTATTVATFQVGSVLSKGLFAGFTMDFHLELLVATEQGLIQQERMNNARRTFLKYIFHEVRNPLNSLTVGIKLLMENNEIMVQDKETLFMMDDSARVMSETLDNVLNLQRIEEGKFELDMIPFSIKDTIKRIVSHFGGILMSKNIMLVHNTSPDMPAIVLGDPDRVSHIIRTFISNAIKFSPLGESICVNCSIRHIKTLASTNSDIVTVDFEVEDHGPGISDEFQQKVIDNFALIRPTTLEKDQVSFY